MLAADTHTVLHFSQEYHKINIHRPQILALKRITGLSYLHHIVQNSGWKVCNFCCDYFIENISHKSSSCSCFNKVIWTYCGIQTYSQVLVLSVLPTLSVFSRLTWETLIPLHFPSVLSPVYMIQNISLISVVQTASSKFCVLWPLYFAFSGLNRT